MTALKCDVCSEPATALCTNDRDGLGGDPHYGSFRSFRCDAHIPDGVKVERLRRPEPSCAKCDVTVEPGATNSLRACEQPDGTLLCIVCESEISEIPPAKAEPAKQRRVA